VGKVLLNVHDEINALRTINPTSLGRSSKCCYFNYLKAFFFKKKKKKMNVLILISLDDHMLHIYLIFFLCVIKLFYENPKC
jgi:hypothetical protein